MYIHICIDRAQRMSFTSTHKNSYNYNATFTLTNESNLYSCISETKRNETKRTNERRKKTGKKTQRHFSTQLLRHLRSNSNGNEK